MDPFVSPVTESDFAYTEEDEERDRLAFEAFLMDMEYLSDADESDKEQAMGDLSRGKGKKKPPQGAHLHATGMTCIHADHQSHALPPRYLLRGKRVLHMVCMFMRSFSMQIRRARREGATCHGGRRRGTGRIMQTTASTHPFSQSRHQT